MCIIHLPDAEAISILIEPQTLKNWVNIVQCWYNIDTSLQKKKKKEYIL